MPYLVFLFLTDIFKALFNCFIEKDFSCQGNKSLSICDVFLCITVQFEIRGRDSAKLYLSVCWRGVT